MIIPEITDSKTTYEGKLITIRVDKLSRDGGKQFVREIAEVSDSVAISAIDQQQRILLIRQYRHPMKRPVWEIPAGRIDNLEEDPKDTALRELREEADVLAEKIQLMTVFGNSVGWTTERTYVYIAHDLKGTTEYERHNEEIDIEKIWIPIEEAQNMVADGSIDDSKTIIGILLAGKFINQPNVYE